MINEIWHRPATIERNNFKLKSLSCWSYNIAVGCEHACGFCYVPQVSTIRMSHILATKGVKDPDAEWGQYVFLRQWDPRAFRSSLSAAQVTPASELNADGNRAVMLCTTTDPYQVLRDRDRNAMTRQLQEHRRRLVREALMIILNESDLNVRILTRSPLAREDFDLMRKFGNRLLFGMSLPTLNNRIAKIYEPKAPAPTQRLETLRAAKAAGIPVYVAVAPVYPECDQADMEATLRAVKELDPVTIFMEPINIRAENAKRIEAHAKSIGETVVTRVYETPEAWFQYAMCQLRYFEGVAKSIGIRDDVLHLWPDASLKSKKYSDADDRRWLERHWAKISRWPEDDLPWD